MKQLKKEERPKYFLNFDIFGYGDAFWLMAKGKEAPMVRAFQKASKGTGLPVLVDEKKNYPPGDDLSFVAADIPTIAIALIDKAEVPVIKQLLQRQRFAPPPILRTIQSNCRLSVGLAW